MYKSPMHRKIIHTLLLFTVLAPQIFGQGMTRSNGIGFRANFWNITGRPMKINVSAASQEANVDISGAGGTLYFFSRIHNNLFFDLTFEAVASVQTVSQADISMPTFPRPPPFPAAHPGNADKPGREAIRVFQLA